MKPLLNVKAAAGLLGVSCGMVYSLVARGELPAIRIRRRILFNESILERWATESSAAGAGGRG